MANKSNLVSVTDITQIVSMINALDAQSAENQYQIAGLLFVIKNQAIHEELGYKTYQELVNAEFYFSLNTSAKYVSLYAHSRRLKYSKKEILRLMRMFGWRRIQPLLAKANKKLTSYEIADLLSGGKNDLNQFNFHIPDDAMAKKFYNMLAKFGCTKSKNGNRLYITSSLIALLADYEYLKGEQ